MNTSSSPTLQSFEELLAWRLSATGFRWLQERVVANQPECRLLGMALGTPYREGKPDPKWDPARDGLAVLVFVERKVDNLPPERRLKNRSADADGRFVEVPTDRGPAKIALDVMSVAEMTPPLQGRPQTAPRGEGWLIEGAGAQFGTVAAFFEDRPAAAKGRRPARWKTTANSPTAPELRVLTAAHVAAAGDAPLAVGGQPDAGRVLALCFTVPAAERWPALKLGGSSRSFSAIDWKVDAAVLSLADYARVALFDGPQPPATTEPPPPAPGPLEPHLGRRVAMSGQTTGLQFGRVFGVAFEWVVPGLPRQLGDLLIGAEGPGRIPASEPGDSGKGVVDEETGRTIGLVWDGFYRVLSGFPADSWAFATATDFALARLGATS